MQESDRNIEKLFLCGALALVCAMINTASLMLLAVSCLEVLSVLTICTVLVAPLIEEGVKRFALWKQMPWMFLLVFCSMETLFAVGADGAFAVVGRITPCLMHASTMLLQWWTRKKSIEKGSRAVSIFGFCGAFAIHAAYNGVLVYLMSRWLF